MDVIPLPDDLNLKLAAQSLGLLSQNMMGITLGYGIYIRIGEFRIEFCPMSIVTCTNMSSFDQLRISYLNILISYFP